jgi:hypothetical protein
MRRLGRLALWTALIPIVGLLACVGPRSLQGPVRGGALLSDGAPRRDVVARLRCFQSGIH